MQQISESELVLMRIIWGNGGTALYSFIMEELEKEQNEWKKNTVLTLLSRLVEELSDETEAFLSCLKEEDRFLFRQLFIEELDPDEIARKNGIKRENLYNRISRGKKKIRSHFPKTGQEKGGADYERFI